MTMYPSGGTGAIRAIPNPRCCSAPRAHAASRSRREARHFYVANREAADPRRRARRPSPASVRSSQPTLDESATRWPPMWPSSRKVWTSGSPPQGAGRSDGAAAGQRGSGSAGCRLRTARSSSSRRRTPCSRAADMAIAVTSTRRCARQRFPPGADAVSQLSVPAALADRLLRPHARPGGRVALSFVHRLRPVARSALDRPRQLPAHATSVRNFPPRCASPSSMWRSRCRSLVLRSPSR